MIFSNAIVFIFGLIIGSFLNCIIYRLEQEKSFLKGRSFCPYCKHVLSWRDLVPLLSFFWLKGRCRYCHAKISWQYPLVEISTALIFLLIFNFSAHGGPALGWQFAFYVIISSFLIIIFVYDLKHYIIPDKVIYSAIVVSGIWYFVSSIFFNFYTSYEIHSPIGGIYSNTIYSAFGAALFFLLIVLMTRGRGMGIGDIKLAFLMGLILGWPDILVALFLAFFLGALFGIFLILLKKKTFKSEVPFGPFLIIGLFLALFFGERLIDWYWGFFLLK